MMPPCASPKTYDLWLRLLGAGDELAVLREALYVFYDRPGSLRAGSTAGELLGGDPAQVGSAGEPRGGRVDEPRPSTRKSASGGG